jgi:hypothetical protein
MVLSVLLFNPIRPFPQPQGLGPPQAAAASGGPGPKASLVHPYFASQVPMSHPLISPLGSGLLALPCVVGLCYRRCVALRRARAAQAMFDARSLSSPIRCQMMPASRVVLVTGGKGLVGRALDEASCTIPGRWIFLGRTEGDLSDPRAASVIFEKYKPTHVIHLAAVVGGLYRNMVRLLEVIRATISLLTRVAGCQS